MTTTPTTQPPKASWYAQWECGACGDGGDELFEDGTLVDADHDCDDGPEIGWDGRAEWGGCGLALETQFDDGDYVKADHDCTTDQ
ncbi:hypothetical protein P3T27_006852 [Kitasatospora sp. MAA19]|uniref:hypothetical protein n=1 Tax=Kitasatospora sp. MAA19 TaxID=3035090 RepID=UPI0024734B10|nr:hypothetical protein [Kitasatospora sp. MAA19]MDH6710103.1 hypothetical protein [Kitasatospora sp. MAA19]